MTQEKEICTEKERDETMCKTTKRDERQGKRQGHDMQMKEGKEKGKCKTRFN